MYKLIGIIGLLCIILGVVLKRRGRRDLWYIIGGILLEIYSISQRDTIFIILQLVFTLASLYDYVKVGKNRWKHPMSY